MWKTTDRFVQQKRVKAVESESKLKQVYLPNQPLNGKMVNGSGPSPLLSSLQNDISNSILNSGKCCESCGSKSSRTNVECTKMLTGQNPILRNGLHGDKHSVACARVVGAIGKNLEGSSILHPNRPHLLQPLLRPSFPVRTWFKGWLEINIFLSVEPGETTGQISGIALSRPDSQAPLYSCTECGKVFNRQGW